LANALSQERDCDVVIFNFGVDAGFDFALFSFFRNRKIKKKRLLLFLTTEGGEADIAYRIARQLQDSYESVSIVVAGWCKSAGTLICVAANELIMLDMGELGPLDVQIAKTDEIGEQGSGLLAEAAFEKLQQESFKMFERHLTHIKEEIKGRITFKTAADIAAQLVVGVMSEIFGKIDPMAVGEDFRANLITREYAARLNLRARNLKEPAALEMLLNGYPSHRFVIDRKEACDLFRNVASPTPGIVALADELGTDIIMPRHQSRNQQPRLEYLNDETSQVAKAKAPVRRSRAPRASEANGPAPDKLPGDIPASLEKTPGLKSAA
jgi:hypothetical protein